MKVQGRGSRWDSNQMQERDGRHEETRTPDLYRVKVSRCCTNNYLQVAGDRLATRKHAEAEALTGDFAGAIPKAHNQTFPAASSFTATRRDDPAGSFDFFECLISAPGNQNSFEQSNN
jgi:hypothetical protein